MSKRKRDQDADLPKQYTLEELLVACSLLKIYFANGYGREKIVEIKICEGGTVRIFNLFRVLTAQYAPEFATSFKDPNVKSIELEGVFYDTMFQFAIWLIDCWWWDQGTDQDLWKDQLPCNRKPKISGNGAELCDGNVLLDNVDSWVIAEQAVDVYLFATTYNIAQLRKDAVDRLCWFFELLRSRLDWSGHSRRLSATIINRAFNHTEPESPLRRILIDGFCIFTDNEDEKLLKEMHKDYVVGIAVRYGANGKTKSLNRCDYHDPLLCKRSKRVLCPSRVRSG